MVKNRPIMKEIKGHVVAFIFRKTTTLVGGKGHVCAYVYFKEPPEVKDYLDIPCCTYHEGKVFGVDTAHAWNKGQDEKERYDDAERQIIEVIEHLEKLKALK